MISTPLGQFRIETPDGLIIERLPIGLAHDMWRLHFVAWGSRSIWDGQGQGRRMSDAFRDRIRVEGLGGDIQQAGGGSAGGTKEQEHHVTFRATDGVSHIRVAYKHDGITVADEVLRLGDGAGRE